MHVHNNATPYKLGRRAPARLIMALTLALATTVGVRAQQAPSRRTSAATPPATVNVPPRVAIPPGYLIGPDDVLTIVFWRDKDMSTEVSVRPDGMITLPLLNDVQAAGLTPDALREHLTVAAARFVAEPNVTVVVKAINSRKVFVTGMVAKPGPYPLTGPTSVMQMLAMAGGLHEFAKSKNITILRTDRTGRQIALPFNYKDVASRKNLKQNIELKPGDTIIVP